MHFLKRIAMMERRKSDGTTRFLQRVSAEGYRNLICVLLSHLLFCACQGTPTGEPELSFINIADGIDYARLRKSQPGQIPADGHVFRFELPKVGLRLLPAGGPTTRRDVNVIARSLEDVVATNASFFDKEDRAMGMVVDQGRAVSKRIISSWGAFVIQEGRAGIYPGSKLSSLPASTLDLVVQGTPRWVIDGVVPKLKAQVARRTALCAQDHLVTLVIATTPVQAQPFANFLARSREKGGLGCMQALNLDGGPSTQLAARIGDIRVNAPGGWGVPNALVALPGLPADASLKRIQSPADMPSSPAHNRPDEPEIRR